MNKVFVNGSYLISSLGFGMEENMKKLYAGESGSCAISDPNLYPDTFFASKIDVARFQAEFKSLFPTNKIEFPFFEQLLLLSIQKTLIECKIDFQTKDTLLILSSTKGNINLLDEKEKGNWEKDRVFLWKSAEVIQAFFGLANPVQVISNACISGVEALSIGYRMIQSGIYKNVIVAGADILSEFVVSGFQSFQSLDAEMCKPFDSERIGLNLGEAVGSCLLSELPITSKVHIIGSGISNDANHISGPSRTGDGLYLAINSALNEAEIPANQVDFISAHGTATNYNDEMESKAFQLAGVQNAQVNSIKGYWGHTLGAAGLIESLASIEAMKQNKSIKTLGYSKHGVSVDLKITKESKSLEINTLLKTASGFGGANAAILFKNEIDDVQM
ncbi:MAG: hypothetical protein JW729_10625 [Bacteroidales bacterium]|nr:hypothetical protein [Bacteroidales bacterium]